MTNELASILGELRVGRPFLVGLDEGHVLTDADFEPRDLGEAGFGSRGPWGNGLYASNDIEVASAGSGANRVHEITIVLKNPLVLDPCYDPEGYDEVRASLRSLSVSGARERFEAVGHDGVLFVDEGFVEVVAFRLASVLDISLVTCPQSTPSFGR